MCRRAVRDWLVLLTMEKYMSRFIERGYDSIAMCKLMMPRDFIIMGIDNAAHRKLLTDGVQLLINSPEHFICGEPCELHAPELNMEVEKIVDDLLDSATVTPSVNVFRLSLNKTPTFEPDELTDLTLLSALMSPPPPPPPIPKILTKSVLNEEVTVQSDQADVPSIKVKISYMCVACPHLKFRSVPDLEQHIAENNEGAEWATHQCGVPLIESYQKVPNPEPLIEVD